MDCSWEQLRIKTSIQGEKRKYNRDNAAALYNKLGPNLQKAMDLFSEKGVSIWLSVLPIEFHEFTLHKTALYLCYGWSIKNSSSRCNCGQLFTTEQLLSCPLGGFPP